MQLLQDLYLLLYSYKFKQLHSSYTVEHTFIILYSVKILLYLFTLTLMYLFTYVHFYSFNLQFL